MSLRTQIKKILGNAAHTPDVNIETPQRSKHGDYATNAAFLLAKEEGGSPKEIAEKLAKKIDAENFEKIEIAGNGFINFFLKKEILFREMEKILKEKETYAKKPFDPARGKINVEFISANPTGPITLGNGRGGFYGDVLARILEYQGSNVEREYYINDTGYQMTILGLAFLEACGLHNTATPIEYQGEYQNEYIKELAKENKDLINEMRDGNPEDLGREMAKKILDKYIKPAIEKRMGITFDRWTSEYDIKEKDYPEKFLKLAKEKELISEKDGATWLLTTKYKDDKDRVLIKSPFKSEEGEKTYFFADAGHYLETKERGFINKINILGADHHGYVSRIKAVSEILEFQSSEVIVMQLVRLVKGGKEVRMSKRKGAFVTIEELIDEVGLDAARYFFLEKSPDTHMDFDIGLAKEQSAKNPVYYIQYAYARCSSILKNAGKVYDARLKSYELLKEKEELNLIKKMAQFPDIIEDTAADYHVHRVPRYAHDLASVFHDFYEKHRVITEDKRLAQARLALVSATHIVLQNTLDILGISAPEQM